MRIMAALLPQAYVLEAGGGSPCSQVEFLLTGDGSGMVWAGETTMKRMGKDGSGLWLWERGRGHRADPAGGRRRLGHGVLTGWTGWLCHLEIRALPEDWDEGTKTGLRSCLL